MNYLGYIDEINRFYVTGWVANRNNWKETLAVDILINGFGQGFCEASMFREELDKFHPEATGRYAFKFYFSDPLSMYSEQEVRIRVRGSSYYLIRNDSLVKPITSDIYAGGHRPSVPIILSTAGRTGSTAVMALLAQHPNVVIAGGKPYGVEMGCYYAYALRTLVAAGDHTKSLRTDTITSSENRFNIGFNPYFEFSYSTVFKDPGELDNFRSGRLSRRLSSAFRDIILDYYEQVAKDQELDNPIYFAEKSLPERDSRLGIRFMFPRAREILLIRDPRDIICSAISSSGSPFDRTLADTLAAAEKIHQILIEEQSSVMFVRYEDFIQERDKTVTALFSFLGLASLTEDKHKMSALFAGHATTASPQASIGRWKTDLTSDQRRKCEVLSPLLERFGYQPA